MVGRKNLSIQPGEEALFDELRYFFYITNRADLTVEQVVELASQRGNQENVIAQLKGAVPAMGMPGNDLTSNWASMVMATLAWNLQAWLALVGPRPRRRAGVAEDGVPDLPASKHGPAGPNWAAGQKVGRSHLRIQPVAEGSANDDRTDSTVRRR